MTEPIYLTPQNHDVTLTWSGISETGRVVYYPDTPTLALESFNPEDGFSRERLDVNLGPEGPTALTDCLFIRDYSQHEGLTASLVENGIVHVLQPITIGPFKAAGFYVMLLTPAVKEKIARQHGIPLDQLDGDRLKALLNS